MPIFDRLRHGVDLTRFKADQLLRINRVQGEIDHLNRSINQIQRKIAGKAIDLHQAGKLANPELEQLCLEIDEIGRVIKEKENQIAAIRSEEAPQYAAPEASWAANPCPNCAFDLPAGATFCPNCGQAVPAPVAAPPEPTVTCPNCGFSAAASADFCPECGHRITPTDPQSTQEG